jgi:hypothetical protein
MENDLLIQAFLFTRREAGVWGAFTPPREQVIHDRTPIFESSADSQVNPVIIH